MAKRSKRAPRRRKLNEQIVRSLQPGPVVWDVHLPAFGIRVGKRKRTWVCAVVRPGSKHPVTLKLGHFPAMTLAAAREKARKTMADGAPATSLHFEQSLIERFLEHGRTRSGRPLRPGTLGTYRSVLTHAAKPLHGRPIAEIRRRDIAALTGRIAAEHGPAYAALTKAALGRFWSWLAEIDLSDSDPVTGSPSYRAPKRERVFSDAEIRALWHVESVGADIALIIKLLLWLGCREQEAGGIRDSEFCDLNGQRLWVLPESRAKNHRGLILPLPRQAIAALDAWPRITGRDLLFGVTSRAGFANWARTKRRLDQHLCFNQTWQYRDCRRTAETGMARLRIPKDVVSRALNHGIPSIVATYDRHHYIDELGEALQTWADELERIVGGS